MSEMSTRGSSDSPQRVCRGREVSSGAQATNHPRADAGCMMEPPAPTSPPVQWRTWPDMLAYVALVMGGVQLLAAGALLMAASTGDEWAWVGYYLAGGIAIFDVPAIALALVALSARRTTPRRGRVTASLAALLVVSPLLLWGFWGLSS